MLWLTFEGYNPDNYHYRLSIVLGTGEENSLNYSGLYSESRSYTCSIYLYLLYQIKINYNLLV